MKIDISKGSIYILQQARHPYHVFQSIILDITETTISYMDTDHKIRSRLLIDDFYAMYDVKEFIRVHAYTMKKLGPKNPLLNYSRADMIGWGIHLTGDSEEKIDEMLSNYQNRNDERD